MFKVVRSFFKKPETVDSLIAPLRTLPEILSKYQDEQQTLALQYESESFDLQEKASRAHNEAYRAGVIARKIREVLDER